MEFSTKQNSLFRFARWFHRKYLRSRFLSNPFYISRIRLFFLIWGYWPLLFLKNISFPEKLKLIVRFFLIDWNIQHAHKPSEIAVICKTIFEHGPATEGEVFVEAGCWLGGSSAKFSIICKKLGYKLHIYDSFEGVEKMSAEQLVDTADYSGLFSGPVDVVRRNLQTYGEVDFCYLHKGWFVNTLAEKPVPWPVRFVYIDCDLVKGTKEVLKGTLLNLVSDGIIFSQDYHIKPVREFLHSPEIWEKLGKNMPTIKYEIHNLASIRFE